MSHFFSCVFLQNVLKQNVAVKCFGILGGGGGLTNTILVSLSSGYFG